jgi:hypothetical protein
MEVEVEHYFIVGYNMYSTPYQVYVIAYRYW